VILAKRTSPTFAAIPIKEIPRFIEESKKTGQIAATRTFRNWVKLKASE
jgi:hypothetical protein